MENHTINKELFLNGARIHFLLITFSLVDFGLSHIFIGADKFLILNNMIKIYYE